MDNRNYYVYIMASQSRVIYVGVTNNLEVRVWQHKTGFSEGFTKKYNVNKLVYFEHCNNINDAIAREKQLKRWSRGKKVFLIEMENPMWDDLAAGWVEV